jgi:hypothetical protein
MKKSLAFLTGICLALSSGLASAAIIGGWNVGNPVALDASGLVNGSKNVADLAKKSHALIAPVAKDVSKVLVRGAGGLALSVAVEELLGAVDWVMDPENNRIKYQSRTVTGAFKIDGKIFNGSLTEACKIAVEGKEVKKTVFIADQNLYKCYYMIEPSGLYGTVYIVDVINSEEKTLPLDTVSQKIISNAQSGNTDAQAVTVAAAQDILNEAENNAEKAKPIVQQLENNSTDLNPPALLSKGRKQNIDNEYVRSVQNKENGDEDPCEWLKNLRNSEPDKAIKKKIKTAEKRFNCDGKNRFDKN